MSTSHRHASALITTHDTDLHTYMHAHESLRCDCSTCDCRCVVAKCGFSFISRVSGSYVISNESLVERRGLIPNNLRRSLDAGLAGGRRQRSTVDTSSSIGCDMCFHVSVLCIDEKYIDTNNRYTHSRTGACVCASV